MTFTRVRHKSLSICFVACFLSTGCTLDQETTAAPSTASTTAGVASSADVALPPSAEAAASAPAGKRFPQRHGASSADAALPPSAEAAASVPAVSSLPAAPVAAPVPVVAAPVPIFSPPVPPTTQGPSPWDEYFWQPPARGEASWGHLSILLLGLVCLYAVQERCPKTEDSKSSRIADKKPRELNANDGRQLDSPKPDNAQSTKTKDARVLHYDVMKFICMWMVTWVHSGLYFYFPANAFLWTFFLAGFSMLAGFVGKDHGALLPTSRTVRNCIVLVLGSIMFNIAYTSSCFAASFFVSKHYYAPNDPQILAPFCWFAVAVVCWRLLLTPAFNALQRLGQGEAFACAFLIIVVLVLQVSFVNSGWALLDNDAIGVYLRASFYAPFYIIGLAKESVVEVELTKNVTRIVAGICVIIFAADHFYHDGMPAWTTYIVKQATFYPPITDSTSWCDILVWLSASACCTMGVLDLLRVLCALPELQGVATRLAYWGTNSFSAYLLNRLCDVGTIPAIYVSTLNDLCNSSQFGNIIARFAIAPLIYFLLSAFFCSAMVDSCLGWCLRPTSLVDACIAPCTRPAGKSKDTLVENGDVEDSSTQLLQGKPRASNIFCCGQRPAGTIVSTTAIPSGELIEDRLPLTRV